MTVFLDACTTTAFLPPKTGDRDGHRSGCGIHGGNRTSDAALLPVLAYLIADGLDRRARDDNDLQGGDRFAVGRCLAARADGIAHLQILQLDGSRVLEILVARRKAQEAGIWLHRHRDFRTGIRREGDDISVDRFDGANALGDCGLARVLA